MEIFSNQFGTVHDDHILLRRSGENIPLRHITSVAYVVKRWWFTGLLIIIGSIAYASFAHTYVMMVLGIALGMLAIKGFPTIIITITDGSKKKLSGVPWNTQRPHDFADALKKQVCEPASPIPGQGEVGSSHSPKKKKFNAVDIFDALS